jgi:hypothetical protein
MKTKAVDQVLPEIRADTDLVRAECERVRTSHGGLLRAEDVVDAARDEATALHSLFTWDDSVAAEKWRLTQARQIIRVFIHKALPADDDEKGKPVRVYISPPEQRSLGGGYLTFDSVKDDPDRRRQMARQLVSDLKRIANSPQYAGFEELQGLLREVGVVADKWYWKLELA